MAKDEALFFKPIFKERIWGGSVLKGLYGDVVPAGPIGEAWVVSAVPGSESVVAGGRYAGRTLADLYEHDRELFPRAKGAFPLLTKILDAADRLSVQVHPDDDYARVHEHQSGKTECWYVLQAEPGARLVIGHTAQTRDELEAAVASGTLETLLVQIPVVAGDFVYIPAGTLHAIGKGIVLLENQQTSDVTYRIYDYNRIDAKGQRRELHLEKGLAVTDVPAKPADIRNFAATTEIVTMVEAPAFTVRKLAVHGSFHYVNKIGRWYVATVVAGEGTFNGRPIAYGDAFVVPSNVGKIDIMGHCDLVLAFIPEGLS